MPRISRPRTGRTGFVFRCLQSKTDVPRPPPKGNKHQLHVSPRQSGASAAFPAGLRWPFRTVPGNEAWESHARVSGTQGHPCTPGARHRVRSGPGSAGNTRSTAVPRETALPRETAPPRRPRGRDPRPCPGRAASRSARCGGEEAAPPTPPMRTRCDPRAIAPSARRVLPQHPLTNHSPRTLPPAAGSVR